MGPVLPTRQNRDKLIELQDKFDQLEAAGVLTTPEHVSVTMKYLNLSFLVQKPKGGTQLVTTFGEVGQYSKPQPSLMPNVDGTLHEIVKWKYIIISDLLQSFYQIPLTQESIKYCGIAISLQRHQSVHLICHGFAWL